MATGNHFFPTQFFPTVTVVGLGNGQFQAKQGAVKTLAEAVSVGSLYSITPFKQQ